MTTVARRAIRSTPFRDADATWALIVDLLTQGKNESARQELESIAGIAATVLGEQSPRDAAIVVTCNGPRTRIYCLYDESAIEGGDANEEQLGFDPLNGNWSLSLPCTGEDLLWVQRALKAKSDRITARDQSEQLGSDSAAAGVGQGLSFDADDFLKL